MPAPVDSPSAQQLRTLAGNEHARPPPARRGGDSPSPKDLPHTTLPMVVHSGRAPRPPDVPQRADGATTRPGPTRSFMESRVLHPQPVGPGPPEPSTTPEEQSTPGQGRTSGQMHMRQVTMVTAVGESRGATLHRLSTPCTATSTDEKPDTPNTTPSGRSTGRTQGVVLGHIRAAAAPRK